MSSEPTTGGETAQAASPEASTRHLVPFREALRYWFRLGFITFGGPAGQIAIMHEELVDRKRWIGEERFLHALSFCMLLPGPEAQQLAIYIGWLLNGIAGGIVAGLLFVLPAFFLIMGLSWTYVTHGDVDWVAAIFYGLRAAVVGLVFAALLRVAARATRNPIAIAIAAAAFIALFIVKVPFPLIIACAALIGFVGSRLRPELFQSAEAEVEEDSSDVVIADDHQTTISKPGVRSLKVLGLGLLVWWGPLLIVIAIRGFEDTLSKEAIFFSQTAMITFGGAYAVLSYINQAAVQNFGWLAPGQMVTGLGLAESTPGPLIMVTEFVGFVAAYRYPGGLDPVVAGILGATITTWATFAPCFLWIFLGAPYIERLRDHKTLNAALSSVTAAVVGIILNLAVVFGLTVLFNEVEQGKALGVTFPIPKLASVDWFALVVAATVFVGIWRYRWPVPWVVAGSALAGLIYRLAF